MKRRISAIASVAAVMFVLGAVPAGAGADPNQLVPYVDVTDVVFNQGTDGNAWVDLTLAGPWVDGSWVDHVFSAFISVDVSNADDFSGLIVQHHDGEWTVAGTYDADGTTAETEPSLFILDSGGIRLNLGSLTGDDLFFLVQSASMQTPDAPRIESNQFAGPVNWSNPNLDPKLRAVAEFNFSLPPGFTAMKEPLFSPTGEPTAAVAPTDLSTDQPATLDEPATPDEPLSDDDAKALADDLDARAQEDLPAPSSDNGGSGTARNVLIIAILIAFSLAVGWTLWRRRLGKPVRAGQKPINELSNDAGISDAEIKAKIDASFSDLVKKYGITFGGDPFETPPDLPEDPPETPDIDIDKIL